MKKILFFTPAPPNSSWGGVELYSQYLAEELFRQGDDVGLAFPVFGVAEVTSAPESAVKFLPLKLSALSHEARYFSYHPEAEEQVRNILTREKPDLIHIQHWHNLTDNLAAIAAELGIPAVATLHDFFAVCPNFDGIDVEFAACKTNVCQSCLPVRFTPELYRIRRERFYREFSLLQKIIVPSIFFQRQWTDIYPDLKDKITHLPHPLLIARKHSRPIRKRVNQFPIKLVTLGVCRRNKGLHILLRALKKLPPGAFTLEIWGADTDPDYTKQLKDMAQGLPVTWHGAYQLTDLRFLDADLAVFPSLFFESYNLALDEVFSLGIPVIVSNLGALPERVKNGGLTFVPGSPDDLANKLELLLADPQLLARLKRGVPRRFLSLSEHASAITSIFNIAITNWNKINAAQAITNHTNLNYLDLKIKIDQKEIFLLKGQNSEWQRQIEHLWCLWRQGKSREAEYQNEIAFLKWQIAELEEYQRQVRAAPAYKLYLLFRKLIGKHLS